MKPTLLVAAAALVAAPAVAQVTTPAAYVANAGASDLYERQSSQLVLASTRDAKVREFAQMMIRDHAKSTADVKAAAARDGVRPAPPKLMAEQARMIAQLRAAKGAARDTTYVTQQKSAHAKALALHQGYAQNGRSPALKAVATKVVPVVQHHGEMLDAM